MNIKDQVSYLFRNRISDENYHLVCRRISVLAVNRMTHKMFEPMFAVDFQFTVEDCIHDYGEDR